MLHNQNSYHDKYLLKSQWYNYGDMLAVLSVKPQITKMHTEKGDSYMTNDNLTMWRPEAWEEFFFKNVCGK